MLQYTIQVDHYSEILGDGGLSVSRDHLPQGDETGPCEKTTGGQQNRGENGK